MGDDTTAYRTEAGRYYQLQLTSRLRKFGLGPDIRADIDTAHEAADRIEELELQLERAQAALSGLSPATEGET